MKPRKPDETDAEYIARLEARNADLKRNNDAHSKFHNYCVEVLRHAASDLGLLMTYAAEICGQKESAEYLSVMEQVDLICGLPWDRDPSGFSLPKRPNWRVVNPDPPSDAGMILNSALEKAKSRREAWEVKSDLFPELKPVEEWDWRTVEYEIWDALSSLEFSRACLRNDLRSAMYDGAIQQIIRAIRRGSDETIEPTKDESGQIPF